MNAKPALSLWTRVIGGIACATASVLATQAAAQASSDQPNLTIPVESRVPATDIRVAKTATADGFEITVANFGTTTVTGIVVTDRAASTGACPATNEVTINSGGVSEGRFTVADLTGAGIVLGTLSGDEIATLTFECRGN